MSLPLTRRIAKTVLLTAAGAASVVGTAGAATAAEMPTTADVGGLSNLDQAAGHALSGDASKGVQAATPMSSSAPLKTASGVASSGVKAAASDSDRVAPETRKLAGNAVTGAGKGVQKQAPQVQNLPTKQVPGQSTQNQPTGQATQPGTKPLQRTAPVKSNLLGGKVLPNGLGTATLGL